MDLFDEILLHGHLKNGKDMVKKEKSRQARQLILLILSSPYLNGAEALLVSGHSQSSPLHRFIEQNQGPSHGGAYPDLIHSPPALNQKQGAELMGI